MEQGGNEVSKYLVVLLQESSEHVIVGHRDGESTMFRELVVLIVRHENKILLRMV